MIAKARVTAAVATMVVPERTHVKVMAVARQPRNMGARAPTIVRARAVADRATMVAREKIPAKDTADAKFRLSTNNRKLSVAAASQFRRFHDKPLRIVPPWHRRGGHLSLVILARS